MTTDLRKTVRGGWWGGLGESEWDEFGGIDLTNVKPNGAFTETYYADPNYDAIDLTNVKAGSPMVFNLPGGEPGWSTPADLTKIANTITSLARQGIKATAPNLTTGACPAGYEFKSGLCIQKSTAGQILPGVSNQTLILAGIAVVVLFSLGSRR